MPSILKIFSNNKISVSALSLKGDTRAINQDNFVVQSFTKKDPKEESLSFNLSSSEEELICAVFDGMGGESEGEMASFVAANKLISLSKNQFVNDIHEGYKELNSAVLDYSKDNNVEGNCGTTAVILSLESKTVQISNVGDSSAYLLRDRKLKKLSHDHSIYQQYKDMGLQPQGNTGKNLLTQFVGIDPNELLIEPYIAPQLELKAGDVFMLCSDGVCGVLSSENIAQILAEKSNAHDKAEKLIELSYEKGSRDNATAVVITYKK